MPLVFVWVHLQHYSLPSVGDLADSFLYRQLLGGSTGDLVDLLGVLVEAVLDDSLEREVFAVRAERLVHLILK